MSKILSVACLIACRMGEMISNKVKGFYGFVSEPVFLFIYVFIYVYYFQRCTSKQSDMTKEKTWTLIYSTCTNSVFKYWAIKDNYMAKG